MGCVVRRGGSVAGGGLIKFKRRALTFKSGCLIGVNPEQTIEATVFQRWAHGSEQSFGTDQHHTFEICVQRSKSPGRKVYDAIWVSIFDV